MTKTNTTTMHATTNGTQAEVSYPETGIKLTFQTRASAPERLACEAELVFGPGPLEGMKLVGFSIWRSPEGEHYLTFPSRAFGAGSDRRFFDYFRTADGGLGVAKRVKRWMLDAFEAARKEGFLGNSEAA